MTTMRDNLTPLYGWLLLFGLILSILVAAPAFAQKAKPKPGRTDMKPDANKGERVQKLLANAGLGSRRQLEALISEGRIKVNGMVAKLGDRASAEDRIEVDGRPVAGRRLSEDRRFAIIYNKPEGEVTRKIFSDLPNFNVLEVKDEILVLARRGQVCVKTFPALFPGPRMERDPHSLVEGIIVSCLAIQSEMANVYCRGEVGWVSRRLRRAGQA